MLFILSLIVVIIGAFVWLSSRKKKFDDNSAYQTSRKVIIIGSGEGGLPVILDTK